MKKILCYVIAVSLGIGIGPIPIYAQDASNFSEPGTGALKQVKTAVQAAQEAEQPKEKEEEPPSAPLRTAVGSAKQTVSQMTSGPEVTWTYRSRSDAPRSLFAKSIAERMK